jgi:competence protein ComEC
MEILPGAKGAIAATLLTGLGAAIPPADRADFDASGLAHLLAVAGLHIGILMGLVYGVTRFLLAMWEFAALTWPTRKIAALAALAAGFFYLELTGAHIPILRSFAMAALVTLGVLTGRRALSLRGLSLAALVLMAAAPDSVLGVSFQMSFSAVLCLIAGAEIARPLLRRIAEAGWRRPLLYGVGLALSSFLAGTASLPFAAYHFGRATLFYVPANMLAVPLTAFWVMPWGMAALALMPLGLDRLALVPMGYGIQGLMAIAHNVAGWPDANVSVPQSPAWGPACIAIGLALAGFFRGRARLAGVLPLAIGLAAPLALPKPDFFVAPDARLIAIRMDAGVFVEAADAASAYENFAPARIWAARGLSGPDLPGAGLMCSPSSCVTKLHGRKIVLVRDAAALDCAADFLLSSTWLHGACPNTLVFDHGFVENHGAVTVALSGPAPVVVTDSDTRGRRPWVIPRRPTLPMAQTE